MSNVIEEKNGVEILIETIVSKMEEIKTEEVKTEEIKKEEIKTEEIKIEEVTETIKTFLQLFEIFLTQDQINLAKFNLKLTPEIQKYFLLLCKESPDLFGIVEETLKKIILDDRIDTKDIPDILVLVSKVHKIINDKKGIPKVDPYELIKTLLHLTLSVYLENYKVENQELLLELLKIVDSSIDLIKLTPIVSKKVGCFFKCK
jgi:hypothetical protein